MQRPLRPSLPVDDAAVLIQHGQKRPSGCGRPRAPDIIVRRSSRAHYAFLTSAVDACPLAYATQDIADCFVTEVALPRQPLRKITAISNYGVLTPGPVVFRRVRQAQPDSAVVVGVASGNVNGVTLVIVDHPKQRLAYELFILHASTDTQDAGLQLAEGSATLIALRPKAAEVWFFGRPPFWATPMKRHQTCYDALRKLAWSYSQKERALIVLVAAVLLAAILPPLLGFRVKIVLTARF